MQIKSWHSESLVVQIRWWMAISSGMRLSGKSGLPEDSKQGLMVSRVESSS